MFHKFFIGFTKDNLLTYLLGGFFMFIANPKVNQKICDIEDVFSSER